MRNYDPALGRFMNIDPMAESYYQHTPYNYVGSNPIVRTDPTGMDWYTDAKGNQTYNEKLTKDNASSILKEGQKYSGTTATENVSNDVGDYTLTFNADVSISSSEVTNSHITEDGTRVWGVGGDSEAGSGVVQGNDRGSGSIQADTGDVGMLWDFGQLLGSFINSIFGNDKSSATQTPTNATSMSASVPETVTAQRYEYSSSDPMRGAIESSVFRGKGRDTIVRTGNESVAKRLNIRDSIKQATIGKRKDAEYKKNH
jgi:hypothetical protein